jgi:hypothetical protein
MPLATLSEGFARMRDAAERCDFAYTWHDAAPIGRSFGRGLLVEGEVLAGARSGAAFEPRYNVLPPCGDEGRLPIALWGGPMTSLLNRAFRVLNRLQPKQRRETHSLFPFARSSTYFRLFGPRGLMESQILLRLADADQFLSELETRIRKHRPPAIFISLKMMTGSESLLRFERHGLCVTVNMSGTVPAMISFPCSTSSPSGSADFRPSSKIRGSRKPSSKSVIPGSAHFARSCGHSIRRDGFDPSSLGD